MCAAACLTQFGGLHLIDMRAVLSGLSAATLPGRFQVCCEAQGGGTIVLDGAHTPESAAGLAQLLCDAFPHTPMAVVLACAADKDHRSGGGVVGGAAWHDRAAHSGRGWVV